MEVKVLITGGAGFVGSHLAEYYAKMNHEVIVFDNFSRNSMLNKEKGTNNYNWRFLINQYQNIKLIKGDIRNSQNVLDAVKNAELIAHLAGQVAVTSSLTNPRLDFEVNALGTFNILEAARKSKSNPVIIYSSTNKVYGHNVNKIPVFEGETRYSYSDVHSLGIDENYSIDLCEHTPYGCSKLAGDLYMQDYGHTYGLKTGVFRMSCIYGERQFGVEDQGWIAWFVIAALLNKPITIFGDGKQVRDTLHVSDLVNAFDDFVNSKLRTEVFNIGGGFENTLSILELVSYLEHLSGKKIYPLYSDWRSGDQKIYISNISKIKEKLGWVPKVDPKNGVKKLFNWVLDEKELLDR